MLKSKKLIRKASVYFLIGDNIQLTFIYSAIKILETSSKPSCYNSSITLHRAPTSSFRLDQEVAKRMTVWVSLYFSQ